MWAQDISQKEVSLLPKCRRDLDFSLFVHFAYENETKESCDFKCIQFFTPANFLFTFP